MDNVYTPISIEFTPTPDALITYLESNLIPDLKESGSHATAKDFETCVTVIKKLQTMLCQCP